MRKMIAALLFALAGCAPVVRFIPTNASVRPREPRPPAEVEVFTVARPERRFTEAGVLSVGNVSLDGAVNALRTEAARAGCDAIVMGTPYQVTTDLAGGEVSHGMVYPATCLLYQ